MMEKHETLDFFADTNKSADDDIQDGLVHIRIMLLDSQKGKAKKKERNVRHPITTVQGLSRDYDLKKMAKACKKELGCNGKWIRHAEYGELFQLQGDQRETVCEWLTKAGLVKPEQLRFHGVWQDTPIILNPRKEY